MRIGFDAKRLYKNFTGLGNYSRTLVKNLLNHNPQPHQYALYTPKTKKTEQTRFFLEHPQLQTFTPNSAFKSLWRSFGISHQLKKDEIDIYHGLSNELPFTIRRKGIKSIVTIHDLIFKVYPHTFPLIDRSIYDVKFKTSCKNADLIIAISESTKRDIVDYYHIPPEKIEVAYQSCDPLFYSMQSAESVDNQIHSLALPSEFMLSVGSIIERKNLKLIVQAIAALPTDLQLPLVVVGKGKTYKKEVETLISRLNLKDKVIWLDNLNSNLTLQALYQKAQIIIYPSIYEGFGLPVVEGLLSKTPVITSNVSSLPEAGGPHSYCINPKSTEALINAIINILSDSEKRNQMIEGGYAFANEKFSPEATSKVILDIYDKLY